MIIANPSKSGGDWWFGNLVTTGKSGLFPRAYVEVVQPSTCFFLFVFHHRLDPMNRESQSNLLLHWRQLRRADIR